MQHQEKSNSHIYRYYIPVVGKTVRTEKKVTKKLKKPIQSSNMNIDAACI